MKYVRRYSNKCCLTGMLIIISFRAIAQCEDLEGSKEEMKDWKSLYCEYFSLDSASSTTQLIRADSVLISYLSNPANETNYAMPCCYFLAEKYAEAELTKNLRRLYKKLEKEDSVNLTIAQKAWRAYYNHEWAFLKKAFVAYANFSKYDQGREIMIETASRQYQMIKDRILTIQSYIDIVTHK